MSVSAAVWCAQHQRRGMGMARIPKMPNGRDFFVRVAPAICRAGVSAAGWKMLGPRLATGASLGAGRFFLRAVKPLAISRLRAKIKDQSRGNQ